jgi:hypothetical protein
LACLEWFAHEELSNLEVQIDSSGTSDNSDSEALCRRKKMKGQQKMTKQSSNLIAHYQTTIDYHRRQMEYYRRKSSEERLNKSKEWSVNPIAH